MLQVGLTGGIASGKSEVSRALAALGAVVVDADLIAREVVEPGRPALAEIAAEFGAGVIRDDGTLDRPALGAIVFGDPERRRRLEQITHPRIRARSAEIVASAPPDAIVVHDNPLLVEMGLHTQMDVVVVVDVPTEVQVERIVSTRGSTEADARARIASQTDRAERAAVADVVLDNTGSLDDLHAAVDALWADLRERQDRAR